MEGEGSEYVVAVDFGGTKIAVGTARLDGELIHATRIETLAELGAEQAVERAIAVGCELIGATDGVCAGAGAVSPGVIEDERVLLAPNVPGWGELRLAALLREGLSVDAVAVGNDVNAAALAEARWGALADVPVGLFLSLGTGIKTGIVINGAVFAGAHGAAGEIGYSLRDPADVAGYATGHAPLEEYAGGRALGERAALLFGEPMTAADVFARPDLGAFVEDALRELSMHVANLAIAVDPERIAVGGGLMGNAPRILPVLRARVAAAVPFPPEVVPGRFLHDGALRGAAALAIDAAGVTGAAP